MSLINKVLQELDQRQSMSAPDGKLPPQQVRAVAPGRQGREWFWRTVATLMIAALGWIGWVAYQLQPRPVATELAFRAVEDAKRKPEVAAASPAAPEQKAAVPKPVPEKPAPAKPAAKQAIAEAQKPAAVPMELFKLAFSIDTPILTRPRPSAPAVKSPVPKEPEKAPDGAPVAKPAAPAAAAQLEHAPAAGATRLEKRERSRAPAERAEAEFRRAVALLNQGRVSEAEELFAAALAMDATHEAARQALVALKIEQRRIEDARRLLQEALALNPAQVPFAMVLARIFAERRDYAAALETLGGAKQAAQDDADFNSLLGAVLQRLQRHREAVDAYQVAVRGGAQNGASWVGLGISLESLQRKPEALDAFRRALATGTLSAEVKTYAEQRARQLQ